MLDLKEYQLTEKIYYNMKLLRTVIQKSNFNQTRRDATIYRPSNGQN